MSETVTLADALQMVRELKRDGYGTHDPFDVFAVARLLQAGDAIGAIGVYGDDLVAGVSDVIPSRFIFDDEEEVG